GDEHHCETLIGQRSAVPPAVLRRFDQRGGIGASAVLEKRDGRDEAIVLHARRAEAAGQPGGASGGVDQKRAIDRLTIIEAKAPRAGAAGNVDDARARSTRDAGGDGAIDQLSLEAAPVEMPAMAI